MSDEKKDEEQEDKTKEVKNATVFMKTINAGAVEGKKIGE